MENGNDGFSPFPSRKILTNLFSEYFFFFATKIFKFECEFFYWMVTTEQSKCLENRWVVGCCPLLGEFLLGGFGLGLGRVVLSRRFPIDKMFFTKFLHGKRIRKCGVVRGLIANRMSLKRSIL